MFIVILLIVAMAFLTNADSVQQTFWSLVPPVIAIALALITKEVYSSLFIGIITGALLYSGYNFEGTLTHIFNDGVIAVLSKSYNMGILVFLVILGIMVQLMNRTGGRARNDRPWLPDLHRRLLQLPDSRQRYASRHRQTQDLPCEARLSD